MAAMRIARTVTGRDKIVMFTGSLPRHLRRGAGAADQVRRAARADADRARHSDGDDRQHASCSTTARPRRSRRIKSRACRRARRRAGRAGAEPATRSSSRASSCTSCAGSPQAAGTALIFDEVVTGFRVHPGGAQALFGIRADIATYGKVIGGGLPIGVVAGKREVHGRARRRRLAVRRRFAPEVGVTFFAGTFVRHPLALAAARAVLDPAAGAGPELQRG